MIILKLFYFFHERYSQKTSKAGYFNYINYKSNIKDMFLVIT